MDQGFAERVSRLLEHNADVRRLAESAAETNLPPVVQLPDVSAARLPITEEDRAQRPSGAALLQALLATSPSREKMRESDEPIPVETKNARAHFGENPRDSDGKPASLEAQTVLHAELTRISEMLSLRSAELKAKERALGEWEHDLQN